MAAIPGFLGIPGINTVVAVREKILPGGAADPPADSITPSSVILKKIHAAGNEAIKSLEQHAIKSRERIAGWKLDYDPQTGKVSDITNKDKLPNPQ